MPREVGAKPAELTGGEKWVAWNIAIDLFDWVELSEVPEELQRALKQVALSSQWLLHNVNYSLGRSDEQVATRHLLDCITSKDNYI
jgi:hypothetical protein